MRKKLATIITVCLLSLTPLTLASAQIDSATMIVDGMTCPFCIYGIEKKLKSVDVIKNAEANLRSATVDLTFKENAVINIKDLDKAVDDSGFTPGEIEITASGILEQYKLADKEYSALRVSGSAQIFLLTDSDHHGQEEYIDPGKIKELSETASKNDGDITITGKIHQHSEDLPPALRVESFEPGSD